MHFCKHHNTAGQTAQSMPFNGLGFVMKAVRAVAQTMTVIHDRAGRDDAWAPVRDRVVQPSGYSLLVALGREIRGR